MILLIAFVLALVISLIFSPSLRDKDSSTAPVIVMFVILLLAGIAAPYWVVPFGPLVWGIAWMPLVITVLIFSFLLAAPSPYKSRRYRNKINGNKVNEEEVAETAAISIFAWILFVLLSIAALVGYLRAA